MAVDGWVVAVVRAIINDTVLDAKISERPEVEISQHGVLLVGRPCPGTVLDIHASYAQLAVFDGECTHVRTGLVGLDEILAGGVAGAVEIDAVEKESFQTRHDQGCGSVRRCDIRPFFSIASPCGLCLVRHQDKCRVGRQRHPHEEDMLKTRIRARRQIAGYGLGRAADEIAGSVSQASGFRQIFQCLGRS